MTHRRIGALLRSTASAGSSRIQENGKTPSAPASSVIIARAAAQEERRCVV